MQLKKIAGLAAFLSLFKGLKWTDANNPFRMYKNKGIVYNIWKELLSERV